MPYPPATNHLNLNNSLLHCAHVINNNLAMSTLTLASSPKSKSANSNSVSAMIYFVVFFFTNKMGYFLSPSKHTNGHVVGSNSDTAQDRRDYDLHARNGLVRTKGGFLDVPGRFCKAAWGNDRERKPTKLLLNVYLQNSFGPVQVLMSPENTVQDLKKAVVETYVREKRRPLLACADPQRFVLHYSQFSLEGLMPEEELNNLGSRNFFLCQKPGNAFVTASNTADNSPFPSIKFMDFLL